MSLLCVAIERSKQPQVIHSQQQMSGSDGRKLIRHKNLHIRPSCAYVYYLDTLHCVSWEVQSETQFLSYTAW